MNKLNELEKKVVEFIECWYECKFTGTVKIEIPFENTYYIRLLLNQKERPLQITYEGSFEEVCKFIIDELKRRRLTDVKYFIGYKNEKRGDCKTN